MCAYEKQKGGGGIMRKVKMAAVLMCALMLCGCSFALNAESLMSPPQLGSEQAQIKQALISSVGKSIKLRYPKNGEYRSAYVIANIDDEPTDEAIVFYERTGLTSSDGKVRMAVLDQKNGEWTAVFDQAGDGNDIERIRIERFGDEDSASLIVGYSVVGAAEKNVVGYTYSDGTLTEFFKDIYSATEVADLDNCGDNELIILSAGASGEAVARLYKKTEGAFVLTGETSVRSGLSGEYASIVKGNLAGGSNALFIDVANGDGTLCTQVLYVVDGVLKNPIYMLQNNSSAETLSKTIRPIKYTSFDIDSDGEVEIPTLSVFPGYETAEKNEQKYITDWNVFDTTKLSFTKKNSGYYSITGGYCFMLPSRWTGSVTIKQDPIEDEVVFYKYEGDINAEMTELMRIAVVKRNAADAKRDAGYIAIAEKGQLEYLVKVQTAEAEPLVPTVSEITYNFILI